MEDKYIYLGDSYIVINGDKREVAQLLDAIQDGKVKLVIPTKNLPPL